MCCSIATSFRDLGRFIKSWKASNFVKFGFQGLNFNIKIDDAYDKVKLETSEAINSSIVSSLEQDVMKFDMLSFRDKQFMVAQNKC